MDSTGSFPRWQYRWSYYPPKNKTKVHFVFIFMCCMLSGTVTCDLVRHLVKKNKCISNLVFCRKAIFSLTVLYQLPTENNIRLLCCLAVRLLEKKKNVEVFLQKELKFNTKYNLWQFMYSDHNLWQFINHDLKIFRSEIYWNIPATLIT